MFFQKYLDSGGSLTSRKHDPVSAAIGIGGSLISGVLGSNAADSAADAQSEASAAAIAEDRRQFDIAREDLAPYREAGSESLDRLRKLASGDFNDFKTSPEYNFRLDEGNKAINRSLASQGMALSGRGVKEAMRYGQGLASDEFGNYWNRLSGLAGTGQTATYQGNTLGAQSAQNIGNYLTSAGSARANSYLNQGQAMNNAIQGGIQNVMLANYLKQ